MFYLFLFHNNFLFINIKYHTFIVLDTLFLKSNTLTNLKTCQEVPLHTNSLILSKILQLNLLFRKLINMLNV